MSNSKLAEKKDLGGAVDKGPHTEAQKSVMRSMAARAGAGGRKRRRGAGGIECDDDGMKELLKGFENMMSETHEKQDKKIEELAESHRHTIDEMKKMARGYEDQLQKERRQFEVEMMKHQEEADKWQNAHKEEVKRLQGEHLKEMEKLQEGHRSKLEELKEGWESMSLADIAWKRFKRCSNTEKAMVIIVLAIVTGGVVWMMSWILSYVLSFVCSYLGYLAEKLGEAIAYVVQQPWFPTFHDCIAVLGDHGTKILKAFVGQGVLFGLVAMFRAFYERSRERENC